MRGNGKHRERECGRLVTKVSDAISGIVIPVRLVCCLYPQLHGTRHVTRPQVVFTRWFTRKEWLQEKNIYMKKNIKAAGNYAGFQD